MRQRLTRFWSSLHLPFVYKCPLPVPLSSPSTCPFLLLLLLSSSSFYFIPSPDVSPRSVYPGEGTYSDTTHAVSDFAGVGGKAVEGGFGGKVDGEAVEAGAVEAGFGRKVDVGADVRDVAVGAERIN